MENRGEPSSPRASRVPPPSDEFINREVDELFNGRPANINVPIPDEYESFIASTARSKIAVVVPMYGYWADAKSEVLTPEVVVEAMDRIHSYTHSWYTFVVAEAQRMDGDVFNALNGVKSGGNMKGLTMPMGSSWPEYVEKGIEVALEETNAQYIMVFNPWGKMQKHGLDMMVERITLNGHSPVVCGFDMSNELQTGEFDLYKTKQPREYASYKAKHMLSFDFIGMKRMVAEMCRLDPRFKTQPYAERDFFQQLAMKGFDAVVSDRVPTTFLRVPWQQYVPDEWYASDLEQFKRKWGFQPADIRI